MEQILKYGKVVRPIVGISFAPDQVSTEGLDVAMLGQQASGAAGSSYCSESLGR